MITRSDPERVITGRLDLVTSDYNRDDITTISVGKRLDHVSEDPFSRFMIVCVNGVARIDFLDRTETMFGCYQCACGEAPTRCLSIHITTNIVVEDIISVDQRTRIEVVDAATIGCGIVGEDAVLHCQCTVAGNAST